MPGVAVRKQARSASESQGEAAAPDPAPIIDSRRFRSDRGLFVNPAAVHGSGCRCLTDSYRALQLSPRTDEGVLILLKVRGKGTALANLIALPITDVAELLGSGARLEIDIALHRF